MYFQFLFFCSFLLKSCYDFAPKNSTEKCAIEIYDNTYNFIVYYLLEWPSWTPRNIRYDKSKVRRTNAELLDAQKQSSSFSFGFVFFLFSVFVTPLNNDDSPGEIMKSNRKRDHFDRTFFSTSIVPNFGDFL